MTRTSSPPFGNSTPAVSCILTIRRHSISPTFCVHILRALFHATPYASHNTKGLVFSNTQEGRQGIGWTLWYHDPSIYIETEPKLKTSLSLYILWFRLSFLARFLLCEGEMILTDCFSRELMCLRTSTKRGYWSIGRKRIHEASLKTLSGHSTRLGTDSISYQALRFSLDGIHMLYCSLMACRFCFSSPNLLCPVSLCGRLLSRSVESDSPFERFSPDTDLPWAAAESHHNSTRCDDRKSIWQEKVCPVDHMIIWWCWPKMDRVHPQHWFCWQRCSLPFNSSALFYLRNMYMNVQLLEPVIYNSYQNALNFWPTLNCSSTFMFRLSSTIISPTWSSLERLMCTELIHPNSCGTTVHLVKTVELIEFKQKNKMTTSSTRKLPKTPLNDDPNWQGIISKSIQTHKESFHHSESWWCCTTYLASLQNQSSSQSQSQATSIMSPRSSHNSP